MSLGFCVVGGVATAGALTEGCRYSLVGRLSRKAAFSSSTISTDGKFLFDIEYRCLLSNSLSQGNKLPTCSRT